jgi:hypothetical protein
MDPIERMERRREAQRRIRLQREKAGELRGRVVAISLICFAALWGIVFVQMVTGNDPVLGDSSSTAVASQRAGRHRRAAKANAVEADVGTDSERASDGASASGEAAETSALEEPETEVVEPEPVEEGLIEAEPEPVTTSQS